MADKSFIEKLNRFVPSQGQYEIMSEVGEYSIRASKEERLMEIDIHLPRLIGKRRLYELEEAIRKAYQLNHVKLLPKYPSNLLSYDYIPEILLETEQVGIVARGFFGDYTYDFSNGKLDITIPFAESGVMLLENAATPKVIENIIFSEFNVRVSVNIHHSEATASGYSGRIKTELEELDKRLQLAETQYERYNSQRDHDSSNAAAEEKPSLPRLQSVYSEDATPAVENGICTIGHCKFDISEPKYVIGDIFEIIPTAISYLSKPCRNIVIIGKVFGFSKDTNRQGDKINITFCMTDGSSSIELKKTGLDLESAKEYCDVIKDGAVLAVRGNARHEIKRDKKDEDLTFTFDSIAEISQIDRVDKAEKKRVELHLHTQMSTMDAIIPPDVIVKTAKKWGHPAVAITDHGNVQGFPEAMIAAEKCGMKVIYGMEAYFVNDTAGASKGKLDNISFFDDVVVFDIETTGLSVDECKIIEIGAVKVHNAEIVDKFNMFVNPLCEIPENITELTSITNEDVATAPTIDVVLPKFFEFVGGDNVMLIAHNADFDTKFIRRAARDLGIPFNNPYTDTLAISRFLNTELTNHKLDTIAKYYKLEDFHHHRACDDAEILAKIFFAMIERLDKFEIKDFARLNREMSTQSDPLKLNTYHQILLVKNKTGLKNLYKLISYSYLDYYRRFPRIPKSVLEKHREGLIIGSACEAGELFRAVIDGKPEGELEEIVNFYDYLEIQPLSNNRFLIEQGKAANEEVLKDYNRRIYELGKKYNKPVVATCDAHFLNDEDEIYRKILLAGMKFSDADKDCHLYFRTTEEMLEEFSYLGEDAAYEVVVENTNLINDMIEEVRPIPKGSYTPHIDGAEEELQELCWTRAKKMYGDPLPDIVKNRLDKELTSIIKNGFAVLYMIAQKLVYFSEQNGYLVGSRGSVGSSVVAHMSGISEVNPLPPHYYCPECQHNEFITDGSVGSGFDLPDKNCPVCGALMKADGHDIPFETFLGFYGDKSPDIDLNFSGDIQGKVHKYTEELFGAENVFRAGTLGTLADKTAYGFIMKYFESKGVSLSRAEMNRMILNCVGVKRTTGQHPGGIIVVPSEYEVYDFSPVQHPADDPKSDIVTTHFAFSYLHDTILKLDELGHDIPTKYKWLEKFSDTSVMDVKMNDSSVYELFLSTKPLGISPDDIDCNVGTYGLPEFGTKFVIGMVEEAKPSTFSDLLTISGLSHGTDVWLGNAQDLIKDGTCTISTVIGCRDNIMNDLIRYGVENATSFKIMESVRKGKGLTPEWEETMKASGVPDWYIASCKKIKYMFPKAHAAAYVMSAIRLGWYKVHMPVAFYCAMLTVAPGGFDAEIVSGGKSAVVRKLKEIEKMGRDATQKDKEMVSTLQLVNECMARGIRFLPISLEKSDSTAFLPENGAIRMPFNSVGGLGENAAIKIIEARNESPFFSVEDLQIRAKLSKSVVDILRSNGALDNLSETDQLSMF